MQVLLACHCRCKRRGRRRRRAGEDLGWALRDGIILLQRMRHLCLDVSEGDLGAFPTQTQRDPEDKSKPDSGIQNAAAERQMRMDGGEVQDWKLDETKSYYWSVSDRRTARTGSSLFPHDVSPPPSSANWGYRQGLVTGVPPARMALDGSHSLPVLETDESST